LAAVAVVTVLVYPAVPQTSTASKTQSAVEVAVGLALATWLAWRWRHPKQVGTSSEPAWMARLDGMPPVLAFGLGAFLPTYAVVVAAVSELLSSGLSQAALFLVALGWVLLASVGVASPLIVLMTRRDDAAEVYGRWRVWIIANSRPVLYLVGGLVCAVLVIKGLVGLLA
jgi:hypothetical protein